MQKLILFFLMAFSAFSIQANTDEVANLYHERIEQRYPQVKFKEFRLLSPEDVPADIKELQEDQLGNLLNFARSYDLFELGWSYENHNDVYEVTVEGGQVVLYTFSDLIIKNGVPDSRRFYQAVRRVDGVFYVGRISDYPLN